MTTDLGGTDDGQGVAIQADGKIVVAGGSGGNFALARYTAAGGLDTSFSGDGLQTTDFGAADGATAVAIQGDGRIVRRRELRRRVSRWRATTLTGGSTRRSAAMVSRPPARWEHSSNDVAIGADGAIVAVGTHAVFNGRAANFAVARYTPGGALAAVVDHRLRLEPIHLRQRRRRRDPGRRPHRRRRATARSRRQFGGYFTRDLQLARYESSGALDFSDSFSDDGRLETSFYADTLGYGLAFDGNGRAVAFGKAGGAFAAGPPQHRRHARRHLLGRRQADRPAPRSPAPTTSVSTASCRPTASWWSSGPRPAATSRSRAFTATRRIPTRRVRTHRKRRSPAVRPGRRT